ncbi:MAG: Ig domain-containing protein, partial [Rhizobiaceae bacterium]
SGLITGVIPADASLAGAFTATITVDDGDGGVASIDVTIDPRNVAPVATASIADLRIGEEDPVDIDISGLFVDGGLDSDPIAVSVTGLPAGVNYDSVLSRISGVIAPGASTQNNYAVTITADDGQGGITLVSFSILVGDNSLVVEQPPLEDVDDLIEFEPIDTQEQEIDAISQVINEIAGLNSTTGLGQSSGIILSTIEGIEPLREATLAGSDDGIPDQVDAMDKMANSTDWLRTSGREGNGDWSVAGKFGYMALTDDIHLAGTNNADERLQRLTIEAESRQGALFIELNNQLDPERDGRVVTTTFTYEGGQQLPDWMKLVREGFISASPPEDISEFHLEVSIVLETGKDLAKQVMIDTTSGAVIEVGEDQVELPKVQAEDEAPGDDSLELGELRGSLQLQGSQDRPSDG